MKTLRIALAVLFWCNVATAVTPDDFNYHLPLITEGQTEMPNRVHLPASVIRLANSDFSNLRVFNQDGVETPYLIKSDIGVPGTGRRSIDLKIVSYDKDAEQETIVLENSRRGVMLTGLDIITSARDFKKSISVKVSSDRVSWEDVVTDVIFDFSSRVNLRKTLVRLAAKDPQFLKVILKNDSNDAIGNSGDIHLKYNGLEFSALKQNQLNFKIQAISGITMGESGTKPQFDREFLPVLSKRLDESNNTIVDLGSPNLPLERLRLRINTPYFYRNVFLFSEERGSPNRELGKGVVYKIPGMNTVKSDLVLPFRNLAETEVWTRDLKLKIVNGNNPPLELEGVDVRWHRRILYFIPLANQKYFLAVGGEVSKVPDYELRRLLSYDPKILATHPIALLGEIAPNVNFKTSPADSRKFRKDQFEKGSLKILLVLLAVILGIWLYKLLTMSKPTEKV